MHFKFPVKNTRWPLKNEKIVSGKTLVYIYFLKKEKLVGALAEL